MKVRKITYTTTLIIAQIVPDDDPTPDRETTRAAIEEGTRKMAALGVEVVSVELLNLEEKEV